MKIPYDNLLDVAELCESAIKAHKIWGHSSEQETQSILSYAAASIRRQVTHVAELEAERDALKELLEPFGRLPVLPTSDLLRACGDVRRYQNNEQ